MTPLAGHPDAADPGSAAARQVLRVGERTILALSDGVVVIPPAFIGTPEHPTAGHDAVRGADGRAPLPVGCFLVPGDTTVLIDAGFGPADHEGRGTLVGGRLLGALADNGFRPADIDVLALSHLHLDHVGWLADLAGRPTFARARVLVGRADWEYFVEGGDAALPLAGHIRAGLLAIAQAGLAGPCWTPTARSRQGSPVSPPPGTHRVTPFSSSPTAPTAPCCLVTPCTARPSSPRPTGPPSRTWTRTSRARPAAASPATSPSAAGWPSAVTFPDCGPGACSKPTRTDPRAAALGPAGRHALTRGLARDPAPRCAGHFVPIVTRPQLTALDRSMLMMIMIWAKSMINISLNGEDLCPQCLAGADR